MNNELGKEFEKEKRLWPNRGTTMVLPVDTEENQEQLQYRLTVSCQKFEQNFPRIRRRLNLYPQAKLPHLNRHFTHL
jgi:hypothetical protein